MTIRTTPSTVNFAAPFRLPGIDDILPAGAYNVNTDEEAFEGIERTVYIRVATWLLIKTPGKTVHHQIAPKDLEAILQLDREATANQYDDSPTPAEASLIVPENAPAASALPRARRRWLPLWSWAGRAKRNSGEG